MSGLTTLGGVLHEEHFRILVWVSGLKNRVSTEYGHRAFDPDDVRERRALQEVIRAVDDVFVHHAFEEEILFPQIRDRNETESAESLAEEHAYIEPIARELSGTAAGLLQGGSDGTLRRKLRSQANELYSAMMSHLVLEEMVVVQRLHALLDADVDEGLALQHSARKLAFASIN